MNPNHTAAPAAHKYPVGDQAKQFHFACMKLSSRLDVSAVENPATGPSGAMKAPPDSASNVGSITSAPAGHQPPAGQFF